MKHNITASAVRSMTMHSAYRFWAPFVAAIGRPITGSYFAPIDPIVPKDRSVYLGSNATFYVIDGDLVSALLTRQKVTVPGLSV